MTDAGDTPLVTELEVATTHLIDARDWAERGSSRLRMMKV
jgi:hypothetical protein